MVPVAALWLCFSVCRGRGRGKLLSVQADGIGKTASMSPGTTQTINWLKPRTSSVDQFGVCSHFRAQVPPQNGFHIRWNPEKEQKEEQGKKVATTFDTFELWCTALNLWLRMPAQKFLCGLSCLPFDLQWFLLIFHGIRFDKFSAFIWPRFPRHPQRVRHHHHHRHWQKCLPNLEVEPVFHFSRKDCNLMVFYKCARPSPIIIIMIRMK